MKKIIRIGDLVSHQNAGRVLHAMVKGIEICESGEKYGRPVTEVSSDELDSAVFDLDNGHWAYGDQIVAGWTAVAS